MANSLSLRRLRRSWSAPAWLTLHVCWPHQNTAGLQTWNVPRDWMIEDVHKSYRTMGWMMSFQNESIMEKLRVSIFRSCILHWYTQYTLTMYQICIFYLYVHYNIYNHVNLGVCVKNSPRYHESTGASWLVNDILHGIQEDHGGESQALHHGGAEDTVFEKKRMKIGSGWWFQTFFIFTIIHPYLGNDPIWLIFFRWVETTNQRVIVKRKWVSTQK